MYKLKSLNELIAQIDMGMDVEFLLYGVRYNISWRGDKPFICTCPDGQAEFFDTPESLFKEYRVNGLPLEKIWMDIEILFM